MEGKNYPIIYDREDGIENAHCLITPFIGPSTYEEAIARIEEAERYIENGDVYDWKDVLKEARQRAKRYEAAIY